MGAHLRANMMYYHIYLYHGNKCNYHCVITQTLQNGQTLGQFFELLYVHSPMTSWALNALALGNNDIQIILDGFLCVSIILSGQRAQGATVFNKAKEKE